MSLNSFFNSKKSKRKAEFMSNVSQEVKDRVATKEPVSYGEWKKFVGNSYERALLYPLMDDNCLMKTAQYFMDHGGIRAVGPWELGIDYKDGLERVLLPLILKRLKPKRDRILEDILDLSEDCYDIDDNKIERAKLKGAKITNPKPDELQIDIDSELAWERFTAQLGNLEYVLQTHLVPNVVESASGYPHRHVTITLPDKLKNEWARVALQFALCSDFKREALGAFRLLAGQKDVTCFFEKVAPAEVPNADDLDFLDAF